MAVDTNVTTEQLPAVPISTVDANSKLEPSSPATEQTAFHLCMPPMSRKRQLPLTPPVDGVGNSHLPHCGLGSEVSVSDSSNFMFQVPFCTSIQNNLSNNGDQASKLSEQQGALQPLSTTPFSIQPSNINSHRTVRVKTPHTNIPVSESDICTRPLNYSVQNDDNRQFQFQNDVFGFNSVAAVPLTTPNKPDNEGMVRRQDTLHPCLLVNQNPVSLPEFSLNMIHTQTGNQDNTEDGENAGHEYSYSYIAQPYKQEPLVSYKQANQSLGLGIPNQAQNLMNIPIPKPGQQSVVQHNFVPFPQQHYFSTHTVAPIKLPLQRARSVDIATMSQRGSNNAVRHHRKYSGSMSYFDHENSLRIIQEGRCDFGSHTLAQDSEVCDNSSEAYLDQIHGTNNQKGSEPFVVENIKHPSKHGESVHTCTEFPKTSLTHASSVADFREFHLSPSEGNSLADRKFHTISMSQVSTLDDGKEAAVKPKKSFGPMHKWSSFTNLEKAHKTGIVKGSNSEASEQFLKSSTTEQRTLQRRRKLPIPPNAPKPFDIKHADPLTAVSTQKLFSYQIPNKHASTGDLTTNQPPPPQRPQYQRWNSIEASTSQHQHVNIPFVQHHHRTGSQLNMWHSAIDIVKDVNRPFSKLIEPSLSQGSLDALPNYCHPINNNALSEHFVSVTDDNGDPLQKRVAKPRNLSLSKEPRDLLRAKLKQAKSMSNLPLFNRSQALRVSPNSTPKSSPSISRTSLHPHDAFLIHKNRSDVRTPVPFSEDFLRDLDPVYHTVHAGMKPPQYLMDWGHKAQYSSNMEVEDFGNLSEANSDDMEYLDSRSYFEGEESQDDDMFFSHIIPSTSPQDREAIAYRFHRDVEGYVDEDGNSQTIPAHVRKISEPALKAERLHQYPVTASESQLEFDRSHKDMQMQCKKSLKLETCSTEQTQEGSEYVRQKYEDAFPSQLRCSNENQVMSSGSRFENPSSPKLDGRRRNGQLTRSVSGHRSKERELYPQTVMVRNSSIEKVKSETERERCLVLEHVGLWALVLSFVCWLGTTALYKCISTTYVYLPVVYRCVLMHNCDDSCRKYVPSFLQP